MIHSIGRRGLIGALAILLAAAAPASAQLQLRLSDTITLRDGTCMLVSDATDKEIPPEAQGPQHCTFQISPSGFFRVFVPGNRDEIIVCTCTIKPDGTITGPARENEGPGAYSATIVGKTKPGTKPANVASVGAIIRVFEAPGTP